MQKKDLHKLGKTDLLTLIYEQEKQIKKLTKEVDNLKLQLEDRTIQMKEAGSIAEASLKINKIFEVAQQAADEYLNSIKEVNKQSHEYAQENESITKEKAHNENLNMFQSQNTYEKLTEDKNKINYNKTKDEISKELVLVKNKIMVLKPNCLEKVVILLMHIGVKILDFMKLITNKAKVLKKRIKLNAKINFIKLKYNIIKILNYINSIYNITKNHMIDFRKYCKLQFPVVISNSSYKIYIYKRKLKSTIKKVCKNFKQRCRNGIFVLLKFVKHIYIKSCCKVYYIYKLIYLIIVKIINHLHCFAQYCNLQFTILKFRIRNKKSANKKLLKEPIKNIDREEKNDNELMVINNEIILYKINILRILKKCIKKFKIFIIKISKNIFKNIIKLQKCVEVFNDMQKIFIKRCCLIIHEYKEFTIKIILHLQGFYRYCAKEFVVLKVRIINKTHHVKMLNEINENIQIEEAKESLVVVNTNIRKSKTKLMVKFIIILKKGLFKIKVTKDKIVIKIQKSSFRKNLKEQNKKKKVHIQKFNFKKKTKQILKIYFSKLKERKKLKEVSKQTHETMIKNMEISIQQLEEELKKRKEKKKKIRFIKTLSYSAMVIIAFAIITSTSFFKILQVSGSSMEPNLHEGELLITSTFFNFDKGDIVAFYYNDSVLIKRIIATEGDIVNIEDDGTVFVNSAKLEEEYVKKLDYGNCDITFPYQVPKNSVFILGDNREVSIDSRSKALGCISKDKIIGKIKFKLNPFVIY